MAFFRSSRKTLTKLRTFKKDLAPIGFYFDIFSTPLFRIPILPVPLRIDKLSNGEPTLFIIPDKNKLQKLSQKFDLHINFPSFYTKGIENLIAYAQIKQKELTHRQLDITKIRKWWTESNSISACNPDLVTSFTFIVAQFIKIYYNIKKDNLDSSKDTEDYKNHLYSYCDVVIKYLRNKIERNIFFTKIGDKIEKEKLYIEKKQKNYPVILKVAVYDSRNKKTNELGFVPYLIYDDLLDSFSYNKKLLENPDNVSIDLKVYEHNQIINKRSSIDYLRPNSNKIVLTDLKLEDILQKLNLF